MDLLNTILKKNKDLISSKLKNFTIKLYKDSEFENLMRLYESVFPKYMSKELWEWKNDKNPFGNFYTILMKDHEEIIAAYSVSPKEFYIYGFKFPCVLSLDTMTNHQYQGLGISTLLANLIYEYAKMKGSYFVYGFPNNNSVYMFEKKLGWINFGKKDLLIKDLIQNNKQMKDFQKYKIVELDKFDDEINSFWELNKKRIPITIKKNKDYLNWRFVDHPFIKYKIFLVYSKKPKQLKAYFILKKYIDNKDVHYVHIIDYLIESNNKRERKEIFSFIDNYSLSEFQNECEKISLWMSEIDLKDLLLNHLDYRVIQMETYFGYKIFRNEKKLINLKSLANWYITMGNNDVF